MKKNDLIHSGRLGRFSESAARYTSSIETDPRILEHVARINLAHVAVLSEMKIIDIETAAPLLAALRKIPPNMELDPNLEDVHSIVEHHVISAVGEEKGGMLNLAKSRNDQVATALRMALRLKIIQIGHTLVALQETLARRALQNADLIMPGYTHLQRAQVVTIGHHLMAYASMLERGLARLLECYARVNFSPMGAGALATSSFNLDRERISSLLGFDDVLENSLDAVSSRDFASEAIYVCAQIMNDLSRLAEEIVLWTSSEFAFAEIADSYAATSSMMPQKKNPVVPETARARAAQVAGDLVSSLGITKSLPLAYNLDLQEVTVNLWSAVDKTLETVSIFKEIVEGISFNREAMLAAAQEDESIFSTEIADYLTRVRGTPFRAAHQRVAALTKQSKGRNAFSSLSEDEIRQALSLDISKKDLQEMLDAQLVLSKRASAGAPNPKLVRIASKRCLESAEEFSAKFGELEARLERSNQSLSKEIDSIVARKKRRR